MSLCVSGPLCWRSADATLHQLPVVLPTALLLVLARRGDWMSRSELAALFWPDIAEETALLNLRVNLHKCRRLLATLPSAPALEAERRRVRWAPELGDSIAGGTATIAAGFDLPGFDRFDEWLQAWRALHAPAAPLVLVDESGEGFFGRRAELARLRNATEGVCVIAGLAGIGKSRLVAQAFPDAACMHCQPGLMAVSFGAVAQLFLAHPEWLGDLGAYRLDVARLLPDIAPDEALPPLDAITARVRLFEGLARCVEAHAGRLVVEDLQWADAASVDWLVQLAHRRRLSWVATVRSNEMPHSTAAALQALDYAGMVCHMPLEGLDRAATAELLQAHRPELVATPESLRAWSEALVAYTGGNAFCSIEVMDAHAPGELPDRLAQRPLPERVAAQVRARLGCLSDAAQALVRAAAMALGRPSLEQLATMAGLEEADSIMALELAQQHGLLVDTRCRHDMVRDAIGNAIGSARAVAMHKRAARYLERMHADPELITYHWRQADEPQRAWPFVMQAAQRLRLRGERQAAAQALSDLMLACTDAALVLRAEIVLGQERLFDDLPAGREALEAALAKTARLDAGAERQQLEAQALAGLVDNAVFSGDMPRGSALAKRLRHCLSSKLPNDILVESHRALMEVAMREPDFEAARASLVAMRKAQAPAAVLASFESQTLWFSGAVRETRSAFERMLEIYPEYCRGLTIENNLAVVCQALGELERAETMARRSLANWAGKPHTETLSLLALGSTLTSAGRFDEAQAVLEQAHRLGQQQGSKLFIGESLARLARLHWCAGRIDGLRECSAAARTQAGEPSEPLRASRLALMEVLGQAKEASAKLSWLESLCERSAQPMVHAHRWRAVASHCAASGARDAALAAVQQLEAVSRNASLSEWLCEALWLRAALAQGGCAVDARRSATNLARERGFAWMTPERLPTTFVVA